MITIPIESEETSSIKSRFQTRLKNFDIYRCYLNEGNNEKYMLTVQAELRTHFLNCRSSKTFTNDERVQLLSETVTKLLNFVELDFERLLFSRKLDFEKINCFMSYETLKGLTIADLFIKDLKRLKKIIGVLKPSEREYNGVLPTPTIFDKLMKDYPKTYQLDLERFKEFERNIQCH